MLNDHIIFLLELILVVLVKVRNGQDKLQCWMTVSDSYWKSF